MELKRFRRSPWRLCFQSLLAVIASASAYAGDTTTLDKITVTGSDVIDNLNLSSPSSTGSRLGLTPMETPASVQILQGDAIRDRGDQTVVGAVSRAVGITSQATPGDGNSALSARGFVGPDSVMQLYDGTQLYVGAGTVTFPYDTWMVDRIEVLSGPASVLYGQGAIGGIVNVIPRRPNPTEFENTVRLGFGSDNTWREAVDSTGPISSKASYRLDLSHNSSDGWVDRGRSESLAISGSLHVDVTPSLHVTVSDDYGDQYPMCYFGTPLIGGQLNTTLRFKNFNVQDAIIHWTDNRTMLRTTWEATDYLTFHNDAYWLYAKRHWHEYEGYVDQPDGTLQRNTFLEIFHNEQQIGDRADATVTTQIFGHKHDFVAGTEINDIRFESTSNSPFDGTDTLNPFNFAPGTFVNLDGTEPHTLSHTQQYGFFSEDRLALADTLSLVGGVRVDSYHLRRNDLVAFTDTTKNLSNTSWRIGSVYNPIPYLALYAQYATAADPVGSLITLNPTNQQFSLSTGRQIEVGVKQALWDNRLEWTLAAYRIVKKNLLVTSPTDPDITEQVGQQSSRGLELSIGAALGGGWRIDANGTILRAKFDQFSESPDGVTVVSRNGNTPPNVPQRVANLWTTWNFRPDWQLSSGIRYVGQTYADTANLLVVPSYYVIDAGLRWTPVPALNFDLHFYNALDQVYAAAPYNGGTQWILGQPRTIEFTV